MGTETSVRIDGSNERLQGDILLEGYSLSQVAEAAQEEDPSFSYYDVLNFFSLTSDQYTPEHHQRLLGEMTASGRSRFSIRDSLPSEIRGRNLQEMAALSAETLQALSRQGFPLSLVGFNLAVGNIAKQNRISSHEASLYAFEDFLRDTPFFRFDNCRSTLPFFMKDILKVSDQPFAKELLAVPSHWGCGTIESNRSCVDRSVISIDSPSSSFISISPPGATYPFGVDRSCPDYNRVIDCMCQGVEHIFGASSYDPKTIIMSGREGKGGSPANTFTQTDRTLVYLDGMRQFKDLFPKHPKSILDIGAGLQSPKNDLPARPRNPPQSVEPYSLVDFALSSLEADLKSLRLDIWDINPRVLTHFEQTSDLPGAGRRDRLVFPEQYQGNWIGPKAQYFTAITRLPGTIFHNQWLDDGEDSGEHYGTIVVNPSPEVSHLFHPQRNDVATDALVEGEDTQYDIVMMLYVFMYMDENAKLLALDKIAKLMAPGGVFVTDYNPTDFRPHGLELVADKTMGKGYNHLVIFKKQATAGR